MKNPLTFLFIIDPQKITLVNDSNHKEYKEREREKGKGVEIERQKERGGWEREMVQKKKSCETDETE